MIFLASRTDAVGYDEYDAHVIIAQDEADALAHLKSGVFNDHKEDMDGDYEISDITA